MTESRTSWSRTVFQDLTAGLVVFLVALPLCLGIALASEAQPFSGLLSGIVGGIVIGLLSGSHTSVAGPAAGLTAVVAAQIATLQSFPAFFLAVFVAGIFQIVLGLARAGFLAAFFPSSVIKGLLAAIGVILILKQIPHVVGHDPDPEGEMSLQQPDQENTFSELFLAATDIHPGAAAIGLLSILLLVAWDRTRALKKSPLPGPLVVVLLGVALNLLFREAGGWWYIENSHLVQVPVADSLDGFLSFLQAPDFSQWLNPAIYVAAFTLAAVASLETLLNLEAVDKLDPRQRISPPNRELLAQGVGNMVCGLIGGLPVTSVIVRSSVNVNAGGQSKLSAIIHGILLLSCVALLPTYLNLIPLSCLAAILLVTGVKLASPALFRQMWQGGKNQFAPFAITVVAIVLTDLLVGVMIGLAVSLGFILWSNMKRPVRTLVEKHLGGNVVHIELANQVSFLNRAALLRVLNDVPRGTHVLLDAQGTDYIDPDILDLLRDFKEKTGPARGVEVSMKGFRRRYMMEDQIQYVDYSTRDLQEAITPAQVLAMLKDGNERFRSGRRLTRDLGRLVTATADGQHPLAVIVSCIDSRTPAELVFDLGVGDVFSVRMAGNVTTREVVGSVEFGCVVAGAKLVVVMGHSRCGAVTAAVELAYSSHASPRVDSCQHLEPIVQEIQESLPPAISRDVAVPTGERKEALVNGVARDNVIRAVRRMRQESDALDHLVREGKIAIVGAMYCVKSGTVEFLSTLEGSRLMPVS